MGPKKREFKDVEDVPRHSFTPGWSRAISEVEGLPVKRNGKVFRVTRLQEDNNDEGDAEIDSDVQEEADEGAAGKVGVTEKKKRQKTEKPASKPMVWVNKSPAEIRKLQLKIAEICNCIVSSPEASLRKKSAKCENGINGVNEDDETGAAQYKMVDLFQMLASADAQEFEMAMLSALVVFKDICPGYRIRSAEDYDKEVQLKKETKSMKDFELSLLGAYQKYIKILESKVAAGLGSAKREISAWGIEEKVGLSALRCQCELLRSLSHFNFRTQLLAGVALRATQPDDNVSALCCDTLTNLIENDTQAELSFEVVRDVGKALMLCKYVASERLVRLLSHVRMTVHEDDARNVHRKAKAERKKRKKNQDEVELGLLESSATADAGNKKRFQADCLHEICLIYFRIVKGKVGFALLPAALEGLGRITHLMNIDTVQDLMTCLKSILEQTSPAAPVDVQLQCVHCALRTLSGPGAELNLDSDVYLHKLRGLLRELPAGFEHWGVVLECIELSFLKKREERANIVLSFVRLLLLSAVHESNTRGHVIYAMAHAVLLRYPRVRQDTLAVRSTMLAGAKGGTAAVAASGDDKAAGKKTVKTPVLFTEDEVVEDLAMKTLREEAVGDNAALENVHWDSAEDKLGDGSWLLPLQRAHIDPRYEAITAALAHKELLPMPLRVPDVKVSATEAFAQRLLFAMQMMPATLGGKTGASAAQRSKAPQSVQGKTFAGGNRQATSGGRANRKGKQRK
jgi:hypothetical protein